MSRIEGIVVGPHGKDSQAAKIEWWLNKKSEGSVVVLSIHDAQECQVGWTADLDAEDLEFLIERLQNLRKRMDT